VTPTVAILALLAAAAPPLSVTKTAERLPVAAPHDQVHLRIRWFEGLLTLDVPEKSVPAVAKRLRGASRLCPIVEPGPASVSLRCTSNRIRAELDLATQEPSLDLRLLTVLPWRPEEDGPPVVPLDPAALGLGPCPGTTPEARGECLLRDGRLAEARAEFEEASRTTRAPLAFVRLGDLALAEDTPEVARELWRRARNEFPYGRMVQARLCDLDPFCLKGHDRAAIYNLSQVAPAVRADLVIRRARHLVLEGELMDAVRFLAPEMGPDGACSSVQGWCRRLLRMALTRTNQDGGEALAIYLGIPGRAEGPMARELLGLAVDQAERAGAPAYAANMLAAITGSVAEADLPAHLKRMAGLFLAGGDRARAEEIVLFARTHLDKATWRREGWEALQKSLHRPRPATAAPSTSSPQAPAADADLAAAQAAVEAARLVLLSQGARP